ncbi:protein ALWAYS EARLY 2-like [Rhododendron vialii]|uniref:protein ALWAYS EARLY 2-like n=1 Tax=Rhododendron vialii TaxID=182163 RepID=UPI00265E5327|nr:protein ALWAYS EARLY 2-like [Rhododendron vialii]XP_058224286.1 protein ALWAYS EARLY 2-like [Rhododendron vialii]
MAPTRKSRSLNKQFSNHSEVSPDKNNGNPIKSRQRKRKLSDLLGSQWSKEELERFYGAYRKYGKDWKKVANVLPSRSLEMVEALYNMNKAYLSLPEGTTSVVGLIAMVTDHYNVLEECVGNEESNDASQISMTPQKRGQGKVQYIASKDDPLLSPPVASINDGCLPLWKQLSDGCVKRKRTPRFQVACSSRKDDKDSHVSPNRSGRKTDWADDVENAAASVLTKACQRGGSPHVSQSPFKKDHMTSSPFQSRLSQSEMDKSKILGPAIDKDSLEGSLGFRVEENGGYTREISALRNKKSFGVLKLYKKGKQVYIKRRKSDNIRIDHCGDDWKSCSHMGNGLNDTDMKEDIDIEVSNPRLEQSSLGKCKTKRNKKLFFGDENPDLDALQTLADLSSMMPASTMESEPFVQLEEKQAFDLAIGSSGHVAVPKQKKNGAREKVQHGFSGEEASITERSKLGGDLASRANAISEGEQQSLSANKPWKRKRKFSSLKVSAEEDEKLVIKNGSTGKMLSPLKHGESIRPAECSSSSDKTSPQNDSAVSTAEVPVETHATLPIKQSKRKMVPGRSKSQKPMKFPGNTLYEANKHSTVQGVPLKDNLSCCLSSSLTRRWCTFEWFYSAIEYPWFAKREFVEYLNHVGLGHIPRLSRVEWGVIRSSLGKPRRFSELFLHEEKEKLKQYRQSVRKHYTELRAGIQDGLPKDLACPLSVGQRVVALHPKSREVHDGSVLTVDHDKCRIQFDRPDLGVEFVMDIDCMPSNSLENMPEDLRRQNIGIDKISMNSCEPRTRQSNTGESVVLSPNEHPENACSPIHILVNQGDVTCAVSKAKATPVDIVNAPQAACGHPFMEVHKQAREADTRALTKQDHAPNKKVSSAVLNLRPCNTYPGNSLSPRMKPSATSGGVNGPTSSMEHHLISDLDSELGSDVVEIVQDSRFKAQTMVDTAMQAMSLIKEGEDAFERIGEALDAFDKGKLTPNCGLAVNGDIVEHRLSSSTPETLQKGYASATKLHNDSEKIEEEISSELITTCVATLLMVQTFTERHPLANVAQILDSSVRSLHPCCPQNLPIYREIQMCMGKIKTQIRALVPT